MPFSWREIVIFFPYRMDQAPIRLTGIPAVDWVLIVISALGYLYWLKALRLSRDSVRSALRLFIIGSLVGIAYYLWRGRIGGDQLAADCILFGLLALLFIKQKRSRNIPAHVKRAVIARDLKGEKYDSRKHHIDHKWAFSRGGSHTTDNLRVIAKKANLKKGAKKPGLWEMFFR